MNLNKRLERIEKAESVKNDRLTGFEIVIVNSSEQVQHPERFKKVLRDEKGSETGFITRTYELERISSE